MAVQQPKYTVRLKVLIEDKSIKDKITYKVFYLRNKPTAIEKFDNYGCSKVYETYIHDIVWFEIYLSGNLIDKIFVTPTLSSKYNDNVYRIKAKPARFVPKEEPKLRKVSFCEALQLFIKNPSVWTMNNPPDVYLDEIGKEQNYIASLGIDFNTTDGVDLQYFLVQHRFRRTVDGFTGFLAWAALKEYIIWGSAKSALDNNRSFAGFWKDVSHDLKGNMSGYLAGSYGLELYTRIYCKK